jgi:hypothetical protein
VAGHLHELVPHDEVQQEENDDVAGEDDGVLVVSLVEVVENREVQLVEQLLVRVLEEDVLQVFVLDQAVRVHDVVYCQ